MRNILIIFILVGFNCIAQSTVKGTTIFSENGIEINLINKDCIEKAKGIEKQLLVLELKNENTYPVMVSFKKELWYDNVCTTCYSKSKEYQINLILEPNSFLTGGCDSKQNSLSVFVKMLNLDNVRQLTNYEFKDIKIEKAN